MPDARHHLERTTPLDPRIRLLPQSAHPDAARVLAARALRSFADGFVSILLPAYLLALGFDALAVGVIATVTLLGSAGMTIAVGALAGRVAIRVLLLAAAALMAGTGLGFAGLQSFWPLLVVAFVGTLNPSSGDVSVFLPLEHTLLSRAVADRDRTALFARYSIAGTLAAALGTLFAAAPDVALARLGLDPLSAIRAMFVLYAAIGLATVLIYRRIGPLPVAEDAKTSRLLGPSRRIVYRLAALFSLDAFAGGFVVQSILALWLFQRFDLSLALAASIFFWSSVLTSLSLLLAPRVARRFGLVNTMVFTHLPANFILLAIPFVAELWLVIALLLMRSLLSQMDVPTRTSYVMAIVTPAERPAAASLTSVPRSLASAASPALAGYLFLASSFAWPLLLCGVLKIVYDLSLLAMFRHLKPPEER